MATVTTRTFSTTLGRRSRIDSGSSRMLAGGTVSPKQKNLTTLPRSRKTFAV
jgi:hypothetical protein